MPKSALKNRDMSVGRSPQTIIQGDAQAVRREFMSDDNVQIGCVESSQGCKEICGTSLQVFLVTKDLNS